MLEQALKQFPVQPHRRRAWRVPRPAGTLAGYLSDHSSMIISSDCSVHQSSSLATHYFFLVIMSGAAAAAGRAASKVGQAAGKAATKANQAGGGKGPDNALNKGAKRDPELYVGQPDY